MRQPLIRRVSPGMRRAMPQTIQAPYGGINGVDALAGGMNPVDAIDLRNFICIDGGLETRAGYAIRNDLGTGAPVHFLHKMPAGDSSIAGSGGKLFSVAGGVTLLASGFTSDRWRCAVMNQRLMLVNGSDAPRTVYAGSVTATAWTGPADLTKLHRVRAHAKRLFFAEKGTASFWYTEAPGNIAGALKSFDLSGIGNRGGTLVDIATMAPDGGLGGDDDAIVFFMSSGEAIVYRGSNPDDAGNWGRVGVFQVARPVVAESHAGDVLTVSADGYSELSRVLPAGRSPVAGFGAKLGRIARRAVADFGHNPGWQVLYHPGQGLLLVHFPQTATSGQQHILNMATGAWSRWTDMPATTWGHIGDALCFGTSDGKICSYGANSDAGAPIVATAQAAWNVMGAPGHKKRIGLVKPYVTSMATPTVRHIIGVDFRAPVYGAAAGLTVADDTGIWDTSDWDHAVWAGAEKVTADFRGGGALGEWIGLGLRVDSQAGPVKWLATTMNVEFGG
ncbi:hypothetical protein FPY71_11575 [Aureimonas fodinaquatilis]|uniref:Uncharacterized protein n=1 Tax=Aureimonas fodinaquatilis TaxID=2565783 RepID=A0A5B0DXJ9_9HYPH|nr:hypothetical protein [Aureimonas fodinaquatilis]KAA0971078.1 hypothetical protein FPY71_11575 [Aureimonas fodinaquatilis]